MGQARLGDWTFDIDPSEIRWGIKANLADKKGLGGKVVQVLSVHYENLKVSTVFTTWQEQWDFVLYMKQVVREDLSQDEPEHMRFLYPPRGLDFTVAVMGIQQASRSVQWTPGTPVQPVTMDLKIIGDAKGITTQMNHEMIDEYINRFSQNFGWKRSSYNGQITPEEVNAHIAGINQRGPLTGVDARLDASIQHGLNTPSPPSPTIPQDYR